MSVGNSDSFQTPPVCIVLPSSSFSSTTRCYRIENVLSTPCIMRHYARLRVSLCVRYQIRIVPTTPRVHHTPVEPDTAVRGRAGGVQQCDRFRRELSTVSGAADTANTAERRYGCWYRIGRLFPLQPTGARDRGEQLLEQPDRHGGQQDGAGAARV